MSRASIILLKDADLLKHTPPGTLDVQSQLKITGNDGFILEMKQQVQKSGLAYPETQSWSLRTEPNLELIYSKYMVFDLPFKYNS